MCFLFHCIFVIDILKEIKRLQTPKPLNSVHYRPQKFCVLLRGVVPVQKKKKRPLSGVAY